MSRKWLTYFVLLSLLLLAIGGISQAQGVSPQGESPDNVSLSVESVVPNGILYQGRLLDGGSPANDVYDFRFRLFDAQTGGHQIGGTVIRNNVRVRNGLFTVSLSFGSPAFTGDARWLQVEVRPGTSTGPYTVLSPRQPIYPVPYALSLRPGATVRDDTSSVTLNSFYRLPPPASLSWKYGIEASSNGSATNATYIGVGGRGRDIGVYGESPSANGYGGKFVNTASGGVALYARAKEDADADLVLGGTASTKDNGVISSDPRYPSSDIVIKVNDNVRIDLDHDKNDSDSDFEIYDENGRLIFDVDDSGTVWQPRTANGLIKAAVYAKCGRSGSTIYRYFNSAGRSITIANGGAAGMCVIDFNFNVHDRFFVAMALPTPIAGILQPRGVSCGFNLPGGSLLPSDKLMCLRWATNGSGSDGSIMVLIY